MTHAVSTVTGMRRIGYSLRDLPVTTLPVYVDPARPDQRFFVDDSALAAD